MAQQYQQPGKNQGADLDQNVLVDALSAALVQAAQNGAGKAAAQEEDLPRIDLMELIYHFLGKIQYVIIAALVGTLLGGMYAQKNVIPYYQATSKLYILSQTGIQLSRSDLSLASNLTMDYQEVFKTWEVHEMVRSELNLNYSYAQMQSMLSVSNPSGTRLLYITVTHRDPQLASDIANAYAKAGKTFIYQVMEGAEPNEFSIALVPGAAIGGSRSGYMVMGFAIGAGLVIAVLLLQFLLDDRPRTPEDVAKMTGVPNLAVVPRELNVYHGDSKPASKLDKLKKLIPTDIAQKINMDKMIKKFKKGEDQE